MNEMSPPGFRPDAVDAAPIVEKPKTDVELALEENADYQRLMAEKAREQEMTPADLARKIMRESATSDLLQVTSLIEGMSDAERAEFLANPETQALAQALFTHELSALRLASAFQVMDLFQLPEVFWTTDEAQNQIKSTAIRALEIGDAGGAVDLIKRCHSDLAYLQAAEMQQAAIACRDVLAKRSGAKIPLRIAQLEADFGLSPRE